MLLTIVKKIKLIILNKYITIKLYKLIITLYEIQNYRIFSNVYIYLYTLLLNKERERVRLIYILFDFEFQLFKLQKKILPTKIFKIGKKF